MKKEDYIKENLDDLFRTWLQRAALTGSILFIFLGVLDYVVTPENFPLFARYRIGIASILLILSFLLTRLRAMSAHYVLGGIGVAASAVAIELMILKFGGHRSSYYAGMILLGVCVIGFMQGSFAFQVTATLLIQAIYLFPIAALERIEDFELFFTSNYFMISIFSVSLCFGYLNHRRLAHELSLQYELERDKEKLEEYSSGLQHLVEERTRELRQYFEVAGVMIVALTPGQTVSRINRRGCEILGYGEEEIVGRNWFDRFVPEKTRGRLRSAFVKMVRGEIEALEYYENPVVTRSGDERIIAWHHRLLKDEAGETIAVLSSGEDVTERKRLEAQLLQAQKMEAVGQLAGGVAHDFNNILTAIVSYGSLLLNKMKGDDTLRTYVSQILSSAEKAANLTHGLLAFSRKQIINPKPTDLNEIVRSVEKLLTRLIGEDVELKTSLTQESATVMVDGGQIEQVMLNLATNARDAMPGGGSLTIRTELAKTGEGRQGSDRGAGRYALLSIEDTGVGMDKKTRERIFEPFFTTKEFGRGTGLGLSTVYGIIKQHHGYIDVFSEPGRGTTFKISLPVVAAEISRARRTEDTALSGGMETILLAEDEADVRVPVKAVLEEYGYTVIDAADGDEAIGKFIENSDRISIAVLDVIMPKRNGKEVYDELKQVKPDIEAIFISGHAADVIQRKGILEEDPPFLQKPFPPQDILKAIREILDRPR